MATIKNYCNSHDYRGLEDTFSKDSESGMSSVRVNYLESEIDYYISAYLSSESNPSSKDLNKEIDFIQGELNNLKRCLK